MTQNFDQLWIMLYFVCIPIWFTYVFHVFALQSTNYSYSVFQRIFGALKLDIQKEHYYKSSDLGAFWILDSCFVNI